MDEWLVLWVDRDDGFWRLDYFNSRSIAVAECKLRQSEGHTDCMVAIATNDCGHVKRMERRLRQALPNTPKPYEIPQEVVEKAQSVAWALIEEDITARLDDAAGDAADHFWDDKGNLLTRRVDALRA